MRRKSAPRKVIPELQQFGQRLQEARLAKGCTQGQLAKEAGVQQSDVSKLESGLQGLSTTRFLALLSAARRLGIRVDYALTGLGPMVVSSEDTTLVDELREVLERHSKQ